MRLLGLMIVLAVMVAACGEDEGGDGAAANEGGTTTPDQTADQAPTDPSATDATSPPDPDGAGTGAGLSVTRSIVTLTDESRTTPATEGGAGQPVRTLPTYLYEPDGDGPFPLIVFAHGLNGHPRKFTILHEAWAQAGYVVAAPTFPVSNDRAPGGGEFTDVGEQPGDMSFVLDQVLGADTPLSVDIDTDRIAAAGLSLGGGTVYGMVYDDCCRDGRIVTAMVLDGNEFGFDVGLAEGPPLLIVHADQDPALPYEAAAGSYAAAEIPAAFLTLHASTHAAPFENDADPTDEVVNDVLLAWLDAYLGGQADAIDRVDTAVDPSGELASWESKL